MNDDPTKSVEELGETREEQAAEPQGEVGLREGEAGAPEHGSREAEAGDAGGFPSPETEEPVGPVEPEEELRSLQEEFESLHDRHLRLAADFENYRRRAETEMRQSWIRAQADLIRRLLDALDDLQRVTDVEPDVTSVGALLEGVQLVEKKIGRALEEAGAEVVDPQGQRFDPTTMEAVMRTDAESEEEDDEVDQVFQKGYTFKGQLVRPARVSVKKHE